MTTKASFTPEAQDALDWWTSRMPEGGYLAFKAEMERAASWIMERYGFDEEIMGAFAVRGDLFTFKR